MTEDTVASLWSQLTTALQQHAPELTAGLNPPPDSDDLQWLRDQGLTEDWVALYACNDGEGAVFGDWHWMRIGGPVDSVRSELARTGDRTRVPVAKDFSGEVLAVEVDPAGRPGRLWELTETGAEVLADDARGWLLRLLRELDDGTWLPEDPPDEDAPHEVHRLEVSVGHLGDWEVGEERSPPSLAEHELCLVRLHPSFVSAVLDADPERVLIIAVDGELPSDRQVLVRSLEVTGAAGAPSGLEVVAHGGATREIHAPEGFPAGARLSVQVSVVESEGVEELDASELAGRLQADGRWIAAELAWQEADDQEDRLCCLAALGRFDEALDLLDAPGLPPQLAARVLLAAGHPEEAEAHTYGTHPSVVRARALASVGRHAAALDVLDDLPDSDSPEVRWWRAEILELAERPDDAAAELKAAAGVSLGLSEHDRRVAHLRAAQLLRQGRMSPPQQATTVALTDEVMPLRDVSVLGDQATVRVSLSPAIAARGRTVDVFLPQGPVAVRLPPGAGHGARLTLPGQGPDGGELLVEVAISMPEGWAPDPSGRHGSMAFDRWTVTVEVPTRAQERESGATIPVSTHDGVLEVPVPAGAAPGDTTVVTGAGLHGPGGKRGDLVVRWR